MNNIPFYDDIEMEDDYDNYDLSQQEKEDHQEYCKQVKADILKSGKKSPIRQVIERKSAFQNAIKYNSNPLIRHFDTIYGHVVNDEIDCLTGVADAIDKYYGSNEYNQFECFDIETKKDGSKKYKLNYDKITDGLIKTLNIVSFNGVIYIYDSFKNKFRENNNDIERIITDKLKQTFKSKPISNVIKEILNRIRAKTTVQEYPFNISNLIPCQNGIYDIITGDLRPHNPVYGFTYTLNCNYNMNADTTDMVKYLNEIVKADDVVYLEQIGACCLLQEAYKKAYMIYNKTGDNGKSLFLSVLTSVFGDDNVSNVSLQDLCKTTFRAAELVGKIANISADLPATYIPDISLFKALTGDDAILVEKKFQHPFKFKNKAPLIFGSNNVPAVSDKSQAFYNRIQLIEFPNKFPINPNKFTELTTEENKSALLNIFIARARYIIDHGIASDNCNIKAMWEEESDITLKYINRCLIRNMSFDAGEQQYEWVLPYEYVRSLYVQFCKDDNSKPHGMKKFDTKMAEHGFIIKSIGVRGEQTKVIMGIQLDDISEYANLEQIEIGDIVVNIPEYDCNTDITKYTTPILT